MEGEEHRDLVQALVINVLRRYTGTLVDSVRSASAEYERVASGQIMDLSYQRAMHVGGLRLMGSAEVAEYLGLKSRQRVSQVRKAPSLKFPDPVAELKMGPVWLASDIEAWEPTWKRKRGHPSKEE